MKLTIKIISPDCFQILEQFTGQSGWVDESIYEDDEFAVFQRRYPDYEKNSVDAASNMNDLKNILYIRGMQRDDDLRQVICGNDLLFIINKLKKAFSDFKVVGVDKFILKGD